MSEIFPEKVLNSPTCRICVLPPAQCGYQSFADENDMTPDEYVIREDGTYNRLTNTFICDKDYVRMEMYGMAWPSDSTPWPTFNPKREEGGE